MDDLPIVTIYTDGGSRPNPGPGGWGVILISQGGTEKELSGAEAHTTNNRMELTAAIEALRALKRPCAVHLHTDSEYLRRGITEWLDAWRANGWRTSGKKPVESQELWQALHAETQRHTIEWHWVKGHAGDRYNERVDRLATAARERLVRSLPPDEASVAFDAEAEIALRVSVPKVGGRGGYAIRVTPADPDTAPVTRTGHEDATNSYRLELVAALDALRSLPPGSAVRVLCPSDTLHKGMTAWVPGWQRRGWRTQSGGAVKHQDLWQALAGEAQQRTVDWVRAPSESPVADELSALAADAARGD